MPILKARQSTSGRFDSSATQRKTIIQETQSSGALLFLKKVERRIAIDLPGTDLEKCNRFFNTFRLVYLAERDQKTYRFIRKHRNLLTTNNVPFHGDFFKTITLINGSGRVALVNYDGMGAFDTNLFHKLLGMMQDPRMAAKVVFRMTFCTRKVGRLTTESHLDTLRRHADEYWRIESDKGWAYSEAVGLRSHGIAAFGAPMYTTQWYMEKR